MKRKEEIPNINANYMTNQNLTWRAKGILTFALILQNTQNLNMRYLRNISKEGKLAFQSGLNQLKINGYYHINWFRDKKGRFIGCKHHFSDSPIIRSLKDGMFDVKISTKNKKYYTATDIKIFINNKELKLENHL